MASIEEIMRARVAQATSTGKHYVEYLRVEDVGWLLGELERIRTALALALSAGREVAEMTEAQGQAERAAVRRILDEQVGYSGVGIDELTDEIMAALGGED